MNKFFEKLLGLRWHVLVLFGFISLFGFYSLGKIKIDAIPDITNKQVIVNTRTFGMDPSKIEKSVTYPIEAELYGVSGLGEMRSISKFGLSQITLIFKDETDIYFARNQVLQRISNLKDQLPFGVNPTIAPLTTGIGEIIIYRVYDPQNKTSLMDLRTLQQFQIASELKKVSGVADVDTIGGFERQLHLNIDPQKITKYGMTADKLISQLKTIGENSGGGYIEKDGQQKIVRTFAGINSFDDIMNVPVKIDYSGKSLPLSHIVEVRQDCSQRLGEATFNGKETVIGTVMLQSGENAREVLTKVKSEIKKFNQRSAVKIELLYDRQFLIDSTIKTVMKNLAEGILLVVGVLCLLLGNFKIGMIVASSLLFCIFILAACMKIFGISANLMSLGALDFGLLVDSSVVFVEYLVGKIGADFLLMNKRPFASSKTSQFSNEQIIAKNVCEGKLKKIAELSSHVAKPILIGIGIIVLVYVPILMFSGIEGKTFKPMAINVIIAMLASLFVAFFLMPVLAYFFINESFAHQNHFFAKISSFYQKLLTKALKNSRKVIFGCIGFFTLSLLLLFFMPSDFLPDLNEGDIVFTIVTEEGSSLSKTTEIIKNIENQIRQEGEVEKTFSRIGIGQTGLDLMPQNSADSFVILKKEFKGKAPQVADRIYKKINSICDNCEISQAQPIEMRFNEMLEGSRADLSLKIFGENFDDLIDITKKIKNILAQNPDVKSAEKDFINSIRKGSFVNVAPDYQKIARHQIGIFDVNNDLSNAMVGVEIGNFYATEFPISIVLHLNEEHRGQIESIKNIPIGVADGGSFPISRVVEVSESQDITSIPRFFGKRYSGLSIYLNNSNYSDFIEWAEKKITENKILPAGYYVEWSGRFENLKSARKQIFTVIPLIILIIFILLYRVFENLQKTLIVFSAIPFALSGAIVLLFVCKIPITISVYIGFIALIGISLLNSIILLNTFKNNGDLETICLARLRPILMTALVASLGFVPMAFANGIGAEVQQPIAVTVIGGIISSTIATLVLNPVLIKKFLRRNLITAKK